jgi:hypothetical protein
LAERVNGLKKEKKKIRLKLMVWHNPGIEAIANSRGF